MDILKELEEVATQLWWLRILLLERGPHAWEIFRDYNLMWRTDLCTTRRQSSRLRDYETTFHAISIVFQFPLLVVPPLLLEYNLQWICPVQSVATPHPSLPRHPVARLEQKVFYIKLQNNKGSEIKFSDNQSLWKVSVRWWIEYIVD